MDYLNRTVPTVSLKPGPAASGSRASMILELMPLAVGTGIYQGARLVLSLVTAAVLGPAMFGTWVMLTLLLQYSAFASLGLPNGAGREVPLRLGQSRPEMAAHAEDVSMTGTLLLGVIAAIAGAVLAAVLVGGQVGMAIILLLGIAILGQHLMLLEQVFLRSRFRFGSAAIQLGLVGATLLAVGLAALPLGIAGLAFALATSYLCAIIAGHMLLERRPRLVWDLADARSMLAIGLPIMLAGLAFTMLTTLDRWLVLAFLGEVAFGIYGLVGIAVSGLLVLVTVIGQQFYPRIAHAYGAGAAPDRLLAIAQRQNAIACGVVAVAILPMVGSAWLLLPVILPAYSAAAAPATCAMLGILAYSASSGYGNLLNSIGAQRDYLTIQIVAIAIDLVAAVALTRAGFGITGVGAALLASMMVYMILLRGRARLALRRLSGSEYAGGGSHDSE